MSNRRAIKLTGKQDVCNYCGEHKDIAELVKSRAKKRGYINYCLVCKRDTNREKRYYCKSYERKSNIVKRAKSVPCSDCGDEYPWFVMDLDHVRGEKKFVLSQAHCYSDEEILAEIEKCDVVCANCHRFRTFSDV